MGIDRLYRVNIWEIPYGIGDNGYGFYALYIMELWELGKVYRLSGLWGWNWEGMDMAELGRRRAIERRVMGLMGNGLGLD